MEQPRKHRHGADAYGREILDAGARDALDMAVRTDALWLRASSDASADMMGAQADVTRLRLVIDTSRGFALAGGGMLTPSLEAGVRHDGGDAETGLGVELGGGLQYQGDGVTIEGSVWTLVAHDDDAYEEWGASASVRIDPEASGRGLSVTLTPAWGNASSATEQRWVVRDAGTLVRDDTFEADSRLDAELGYGLGIAHGLGVLTPYAGLGRSNAGGRAWRTGARWRVTEGFTIELEGTRREPANDDAAEHGIALRASLRW